MGKRLALFAAAVVLAVIFIRPLAAGISGVVHSAALNANTSDGIVLMVVLAVVAGAVFVVLRRMSIIR